MHVSYCRIWNYWTSNPIDPLSVSDARRHDVSGELYTAVVGPLEDPDAIVEVVRPEHIGVHFLDEKRRKWQTFTFWLVDKKMFLKSIIRWQYGDDSARLINESELIEEITYKVDGTVRREITDEKAHERTVTDYRDVNLDINWEPVPEFGDWGSITRFDRDKPARQA